MCLREGKWLLTLLMLLTAGTVWGEPRLKSLVVHVQLADNGDARITETRTMTIDDMGTECYVVIGNLNGSRIKDITITDETDSVYASHNPWETSRSRSAKTNQWGLIKTDHGYELCWGLGQNGERTYTTSYTITSLVRSYDDYDGFNYMFVAEHLKPHAEHAKVVISKNDDFTEEDVKMWAFRFEGEVNLIDGTVVAETSEELGYDHSMIVMLQFEKGVLHPTKRMKGSFETVKERAFEGSDYSLMDKFKEYAAWLAVFAPTILSILIMMWPYIRIWRFRRLVNKDLMWYRDLPYKGNLQRANQVLDAMRYRGRNTKSLISACVLRLVSVQALRIEPAGNGSGDSVLVIGDLQRVRGLADTALLRSLHRIFREAAGVDGVLQPKELKKWMGDYKNREKLVDFLQQATAQRSIKELKKEIVECRKVLGHRLFLEEFTLANERHAVEVELWKDYLVYAELFGIAKQVRKDMKKVNPDYFQMDEVLTAMCNTRELPSLLNVSTQGLVSVLKSLHRDSARSDGGGGSSSIDGGGGYSGGGSGGGIR
jgi:uncharacterized membrane protein YgcG